MKEHIKKLLREGLLKEKSLELVNIGDFNLEGITHNWLMSSPSTVVHNYKFEMQDDYYLSPEEKDDLMDEDEDEIMETERFKEWLKYEVEAKIENVIDEISDYIKGDLITIWRVMTVDDNWIKNLASTGMRLGKYWSFEEDAAEAHWGGNQGNTVRIQTTIKEKYIDWQQTIEANIDPNIGEDEKEITLFKNTPITIQGLEVNGKEMNIEPIKNKIFKA